MIEIMKSRNIIIADESFTKMALQNFSYYSIVNGYKNTFLQLPNSEKFIEGTRFEELYTLHSIDTSLNTILFKYIIYIEKSLKSRISYLISENYGVYTDWNDMSNNNPDDYLYNRYYSNSTGKRDTILRKIKECITNQRNNPSLIHYRNTKNHIPPWIITTNIPFGLSIEWYTILKGIHKSDICSQFLSSEALTIDERKEFFIKALSLIKEYRNKIAHGNRTFSIMQLPILPKKAAILLSLGNLKEYEYNSRLGQNDLFSVILVILILLNDSYLLTGFYRELYTLFIPYEQNNILFNGKSVYEVFGLPNNTLDQIQKLLEARFT